jgi:alkylhydroperoxidase family enzyme
MTWIKTIPDHQADDRLREALEQQRALYPAEYAQPTQVVADQASGIVAAHSLIPQALFHAFATFGALMAPELPLARRQHEMIATVVSLTNKCHY